MRASTAAVVLVALQAAGSAALAGQDAATILDLADTHWRWQRASRPAVVHAADGPLRTLAGKEIAPADAVRITPGLPADWAAVDCDDQTWPRTSGRRLGGVGFHGVTTGVVRLRGKFAVTDPSAVRGLTLEMTFRGGVVVCLNGTEVARASLPDGELAPGAAALPYPDEAFLDAKGKLLPEVNPYRIKHMPADARKALLARLARRDRRRQPTPVATRLLRKGVNVLAIEVHRSDYHPKATTFIGRKAKQKWVPCGLSSLRLAAIGGGVRPNCSRPTGLQVWNCDRNDRLSGAEYGDPNEPLRPVELVTARNGVAAGRVVVSSTGPIRGLKARAGALTASAGDGKIAPANVTVLYETRSLNKWFCRLSPTAPAEVAVPKARGAAAMQPVWVSVQVPRDAAPGDYEGSLTVTVGGAKDVVVPVRLHVARWTLPAPRDFRTPVALYQSPTSLAKHYKVAEWSEPHWKLMDKSFELLGRVGCDFVNVDVVDQTVFGNDDGMIRWIKKPDGSYDHDFSTFERFLALARRHLGVPEVVAFQVWHAGGWASRKADQKNTVTVVDAAGKRSHLQVPPFATDEAKAFWRPVFAGIRKRLAAVGMEDRLCIGIISDGMPPRDVCAMFDEVLAPARWMRSSHRPNTADAPSPLKGGGVIVYNEGVYGLWPVALDEALPLSKGLRRPSVYYQRDNNGQPGALSVLSSRTMPEWSLYSHQHGFGRIGLDYWPGLMERPSSRGGYVLFRRWLHSRSHPGSVNPPWMAYPGPEGAESSVCLESMREGLQEAEAVIGLSDALEGSRDRLGDDLAGRCRAILAERHEFVCRLPRWAWQTVYYNLNHYGWQDLSRRTLAIAGEVDRRLAPDLP